MTASPSDAVSGKPLTPRQQRFVQEILVDGVVAAAARRAGYSAKASLYSQGQLMKNPRVLAAIAAERARRAAPMTREQAIEGLRQIAEATVLDYARPGPDGALELDLWRLERDRAGPIRELSLVEKTDPASGAVTRTVSFKLADRAAALAKLAPLLTSEATLKALDKGYAEGVESILDLEVGEFTEMKAYWTAKRRATGYNRVKSGAELAWRQHDFWRREMMAKQAETWEPPTDEDEEAMDREVLEYEARERERERERRARAG